MPAAAVSDGLASVLESMDMAGNGPARFASPEAPHAVAVDAGPPAERAWQGWPYVALGAGVGTAALALFYGSRRRPR